MAKGFIPSVLSFGGHHVGSGEYCLLEAVAAYAGLGHSDNPRCSSRVIATFGRQLNDLFYNDDQLRTLKLAHLIPAIAASRNDRLETKRELILIDFVLRQVVPVHLEETDPVAANFFKNYKSIEKVDDLIDAYQFFRSNWTNDITEYNDRFPALLQNIFITVYDRAACATALYTHVIHRHENSGLLDLGVEALKAMLAVK